MNDETKLPKWAQRKLNELRHEIKSLKALKDVYAILSDTKRDWFAVHGPKFNNNNNEPLTLWVLYPNKPHAVCSLSANDVLFVGRALEEKSTK